MDESNKFKYGMVFLVLGVLLIVWAWGSWTFRIVPVSTTDEIYDNSVDLDESVDVDESDGADESIDAEKASTLNGSSTTKNNAYITAWRYSLFVLLALVLLALFGSYFIIRIARRYRAKAAHDRAPPTKFEDVWSSHKMPKE